MTAAIVIAAAAVVAAGMTLTMMVMMVAAHIGIIAQGSCQEVFHNGIRITEAAAVELDACLLEGHLSAAADTAAD